MSKLILHPQTRSRIDDFIAHPSHALLVVGPAGVGKSSVARDLALQLLSIEPEKLTSHPYATVVKPTKERTISIDTVRQLVKFMTLKVPGAAQRVVIVEDAHFLTTEAQNAFLKTLEEPPEGTTLILTTTSERALLPTIQSRASSITVSRPELSELEKHLRDLNYPASAVQQAVLMSGGLPGLTQALLNEDNSHPLVEAAQIARQLLRHTTFERLTMVDALAKQREDCLNVLAMMQQMAHTALQQAATKSTSQIKTWQRVLANSYRANELLLLNAQTKLVLTDLMLNL